MEPNKNADNLADESPYDAMLSETSMMKEKGDPEKFTPPKEPPVLDDSTDTDRSDQEKGTQDKAQTPDDDTDWKKRHGDAVRWAQQIKQEKERLERELLNTQQKFKHYEEAGLDFDEIDKFIEGNSGTPQRSKNMDTSAENDKFVTVDQFNNIVTRYNYDMAKRDYADANPEFRDPDIQELLDIEAQRLASDEIKQYGSVTSQLDHLVKNASKRVIKKINKFKNLGAKSITEKREKIKTSAMTEGMSRKKDVEEKDSETFSAKDYAKSLRNHRQNIMRRTSR